jgi:enoyl-CoA hydratase/carnithine racemase
MAAPTSLRRLSIAEVLPEYWRITIDNPPLNLFDPEMFAECRLLMDRIDNDRNVQVVVFDSANPEFFIAHIDLLRRDEVVDVPGYAPYSAWPSFVSRLAESPVISIASVRGRARGHGNEFLLACDMRFASRERAILGQLEVGLGVIPGGGGVEWLSALTGRSRALEIITSSADYDADTAERYGWVNRAILDADLDEFVDSLARRLAGFDPAVLRLAKASVNSRAGVPSPRRPVGLQLGIQFSRLTAGCADRRGRRIQPGFAATR